MSVVHGNIEYPLDWLKETDQDASKCDTTQVVYDFLLRLLTMLLEIPVGDSTRNKVGCHVADEAAEKQVVEEVESQHPQHLVDFSVLDGCLKSE